MWPGPLTMNLSRRISKEPSYDASRRRARPGLLPGVAGGIEPPCRALRFETGLARVR